MLLLSLVPQIDSGQRGWMRHDVRETSEDKTRGPARTSEPAPANSTAPIIGEMNRNDWKYRVHYKKSQ